MSVSNGNGGLSFSGDNARKALYAVHPLCYFDFSFAGVCKASACENFGQNSCQSW